MTMMMVMMMVIVVDVPRSSTLNITALTPNFTSYMVLFSEGRAGCVSVRCLKKRIQTCHALNNLRHRVYRHTPLWRVQSVLRKKRCEVVTLTPIISCTFKFLQTWRPCNVIWWCSLGDIARFLPSTYTKSRRSLPAFVKINCSPLVPVPDSTLEWPEVLYVWNAGGDIHPQNQHSSKNIKKHWIWFDPSFSADNMMATHRGGHQYCSWCTGTVGGGCNIWFCMCLERPKPEETWWLLIRRCTLHHILNTFKSVAEMLLFLVNLRGEMDQELPGTKRAIPKGSKPLANMFLSTAIVSNYKKMLVLLLIAVWSHAAVLLLKYA